jgi:hypothetical protein
MYYPKSQIVTNLYTNGQEYVVKSTSENYIGNYWKTSDGKFFTGKTPEDKNIQELIVATSDISLQYSNLTSEAFELKTTSAYLNNSSVIAGEYNKLNDKLLNVNLLPTSFNPQPTQDDYNLGEFTRYFCKKTNELIYIEINKDTYDKLVGQEPTYLWQLYTPFKYQWIISGNKETVYKTNEQVTTYMITKFKFPAFNKFLKEDYLKFWKSE